MESIVSYPQRGAGGKSSYRGNFAPQLVADLLDQFRPGFVVDPMLGGGTTADVCNSRGAGFWGSDLSQGFDILTDEIPVGADLGILHPPYHCLHPDTPVILADGSVKPVADVKVGDKTINKNGHATEVLAVASKPNTQKIIEINVRGQAIDSLKVTENHLCLVVETKRCKYPSQARFCTTQCNHISNRKGSCKSNDAPYHAYRPIWKPAGKIVPGDCLLYAPLRPQAMSTEIHISQFLRGEWFSEKDGVIWYQKNKTGQTTRKGVCQYQLPDRISLTEDFGYLAGLFIAEGSSPTRDDAGAIYFTFHSKESELINSCQDLMKRLFGISHAQTFSQPAINNSIRVAFYSKPLAIFFSAVFGMGARNKKVPEFLMTAPKAVQMVLLKGLFHGDGCTRFSSYVTTSRTLIEQVRMLCFMNDLSMSIFYANKQKKLTQICGNLVHAGVSYYGQMPKGAYSQVIGVNTASWRDKAIRFDHMIGFVVTSTRKSSYEGPVYDLQVSSGESFLTPSGIVHNCMIRYSGEMWGKPDPRDLSRCPDYDTFIRRLNEAIYRLFESLRSGGRLAVLVGQLRRNGRLYPIDRDMAWYGDVEAVVIKAQHNMTSSRTTYSAKSFIPIVHEVLVVTRKPQGWVVTMRKTDVLTFDARQYRRAAWRAVVQAGLEALGGKAPLQELYAALEDHARVRHSKSNGTDWKAQIRRALQVYPDFARVCEGVWELVSPVTMATSCKMEVAV